MGCNSLLQWIFPTQGLNLGLLQWQADSLLEKEMAAHSSILVVLLTASSSEAEGSTSVWITATSKLLAHWLPQRGTRRDPDLGLWEMGLPDFESWCQSIADV